MKYKTSIVLAYFAECGLPQPETEYRFHPERKWRFDFAWLRHSLDFSSPSDSKINQPHIALEVQGGIWFAGRHNRGAAMLKEWEKLNEAAAMGWRVLYCQPKDLCTLATATLIARCLGISPNPNFVSVGVEDDCAP